MDSKHSSSPDSLVSVMELLAGRPLTVAEKKAFDEVANSRFELVTGAAFTGGPDSKVSPRDFARYVHAAHDYAAFNKLVKQYRFEQHPNTITDDFRALFHDLLAARLQSQAFQTVACSSSVGEQPNMILPANFILANEKAQLITQPFVDLLNSVVTGNDISAAGLANRLPSARTGISLVHQSDEVIVKYRPSGPSVTPEINKHLDRVEEAKVDLSLVWKTLHRAVPHKSSSSKFTGGHVSIGESILYLGSCTDHRMHALIDKQRAIAASKSNPMLWPDKDSEELVNHLYSVHHDIEVSLTLLNVLVTLLCDSNDATIEGTRHSLNKRRREYIEQRTGFNRHLQLSAAHDRTSADLLSETAKMAALADNEFSLAQSSDDKGPTTDAVLQALESLLMMERAFRSHTFGNSYSAIRQRERVRDLGVSYDTRHRSDFRICPLMQPMPRIAGHPITSVENRALGEHDRIALSIGLRPALSDARLSATGQSCAVNDLMLRSVATGKFDRPLPRHVGPVGPTGWSDMEKYADTALQATVVSVAAFLAKVSNRPKELTMAWANAWYSNMRSAISFVSAAQHPSDRCAMYGSMRDLWFAGMLYQEARVKGNRAVTESEEVLVANHQLMNYLAECVCLLCRYGESPESLTVVFPDTMLKLALLLHRYVVDHPRSMPPKSDPEFAANSDALTRCRTAFLLMKSAGLMGATDTPEDTSLRTAQMASARTIVTDGVCEQIMESIHQSRPDSAPGFVSADSSSAGTDDGLRNALRSILRSSVAPTDDVYTVLNHVRNHILETGLLLAAFSSRTYSVRATIHADDQNTTQVSQKSAVVHIGGTSHTDFSKCDFLPMLSVSDFKKASAQSRSESDDPYGIGINRAFDGIDASGPNVEAEFSPKHAAPSTVPCLLQDPERPVKFSDDEPQPVDSKRLAESSTSAVYAMLMKAPVVAAASSSPLARSRRDSDSDRDDYGVPSFDDEGDSTMHGAGEGEDEETVENDGKNVRIPETPPDLEMAPQPLKNGEGKRGQKYQQQQQQQKQQPEDEKENEEETVVKVEAEEEHERKDTEMAFEDSNNSDNNNNDDYNPFTPIDAPVQPIVERSSEKKTQRLGTNSSSSSSSKKRGPSSIVNPQSFEDDNGDGDGDRRVRPRVDSKQQQEQQSQIRTAFVHSITGIVSKIDLKTTRGWTLPTHDFTLYNKTKDWNILYSMDSLNTQVTLPTDLQLVPYLEGNVPKRFGFGSSEPRLVECIGCVSTSAIKSGAVFARIGGVVVPRFRTDMGMAGYRYTASCIPLGPYFALDVGSLRDAFLAEKRELYAHRGDKTGLEKYVDNLPFDVDDGDRVAITGMSDATKSQLSSLSCNRLLPGPGFVVPIIEYAKERKLPDVNDSVNPDDTPRGVIDDPFTAVNCDIQLFTSEKNAHLVDTRAPSGNDDGMYVSSKHLLTPPVACLVARQNINPGERLFASAFNLVKQHNRLCIVRDSMAPLKFKAVVQNAALMPGEHIQSHFVWGREDHVVFAREMIESLRAAADIQNKETVAGTPTNGLVVFPDGKVLYHYPFDRKDHGGWQQSITRVDIFRGFPMPMFNTRDETVVACVPFFFPTLTLPSWTSEYKASIRPNCRIVLTETQDGKFQSTTFIVTRKIDIGETFVPSLYISDDAQLRGTERFLSADRVLGMIRDAKKNKRSLKSDNKNNSNSNNSNSNDGDAYMDKEIGGVVEASDNDFLADAAYFNAVMKQNERLAALFGDAKSAVQAELERKAQLEADEEEGGKGEKGKGKGAKTARPKRVLSRAQKDKLNARRKELRAMKKQMEQTTGESSASKKKKNTSKSKTAGDESVDMEDDDPDLY